MTDTLDPGDVDDEGALVAADRQLGTANNQEWLKMTKGQSLLCSFLYFHPVDVNAVKTLRKTNKAASADEIAAAATKALQERAAALNKSVEHLTEDERLDLGTVQFKSIKAHYQQGLGFALSRLGMDGAEADSVWKQLPEPRQYFTTLLLIYPMTREDKHDNEATKAGRWRILPWRFGPGTYDQIWNLNDRLRCKQMSIANRDLRLECTDTAHQSIRASDSSEAVWQTSENVRRRVLRSAIEHYPRLVPFRQMSTDQLREKLGVSGTVLDEPGRDVSALLDIV